MINESNLNHLAKLARLKLKEEDQARLIKELSSIVLMFESLDKINTEGIEPMAHALEMTQRLRQDQVTETDQRELMQSIAPKHLAGFYLVPQVIE